MQHNRIFGMEESGHPDITQMPIFLAWYPQDQPTQITAWGRQSASVTCDALAALPPGKRTVMLRWVLVYESYPSQGVDPVEVFTSGGYPTARSIRMLRQFGRELRSRNMYLDGIYMENEGTLSNWNLTYNQLQTILSSPAARAKMPPAVRSLTLDHFDWRHPQFQQSVLKFNRYGAQLIMRALRRVVVDSGIFKISRGPGLPPVQPPTVNFNFVTPTFTVYDANGWPWLNMPIDRVSSAPGLYLGSGGRYKHYLRQHRPLWNALVDSVNMFRSCMRRPGAKIWPVVTWPSNVNTWLYEQMIAHGVRTGINWTNGGNAWYYWREPWINQGVEDPLMVSIFDRHDQAFPVLNNLPEVALDCDQIDTAGFVTTYQDFLANVPPDAPGNDPLIMNDPTRMSPRLPRLASVNEMAIS